MCLRTKVDIRQIYKRYDGLHHIIMLDAIEEYVNNRLTEQAESIEREVQSFSDATDNDMLKKAHKVDLDIIRRHKKLNHG